MSGMECMNVVGVPLYSQRRRASEPRNVETVNYLAWVSLLERIMLSFQQWHFAQSFPTKCSTRCRGVLDTNESAFQSVLRIEIPALNWASIKQTADLVNTEPIFDLIEFCYARISYATREKRERPYCGHVPLRFDRVRGRELFLSDVNRIFDREKIRFELNEDGKIVRFGAPILSDEIRDTMFRTGDTQLDEILETVTDKFISRNTAMRREALEKLWDAWERLKTLEPGRDKKTSANTLLNRAANGPLRERLETEARELTKIGNDFMIRHSETDKHPLTDDRHVDYLFHRMFSMVYLLLDATGRLGSRSS